MNDALVEKVARAIHDATWGHGAYDSPSTCEVERLEAQGQARAAIPAMSETWSQEAADRIEELERALRVIVDAFEDIDMTDTQAFRLMERTARAALSETEKTPPP